MRDVIVWAFIRRDVIVGLQEEERVTVKAELGLPHYRI
jgi:hypothetical protein